MKRAQKREKQYSRIGRRFMSAKVPHNAWSLSEIYGRSTRWAKVFTSRQAGARLQEGYERFRNELLDTIYLSTPVLTHMLRDARDGDSHE